jgi:formiminoglutamase/agmatinase
LIQFQGAAPARHRFSVIGFPWDFGSSLGRPGARYGPEEIRKSAAWNLNRIREGRVWDLEGGQVVDLNAVEIVDQGDVDIAAHDTELTFQRAQAMVAAALEGGRFPIVLGGDHAISLPPIRALAAARPRIGIIQLDAHLDLVDFSPRQGSLSQSNQIRRALELPQMSAVRLIQVGLRGLNYPEYADFCREQGITQLTAGEALEEGAEAVAARCLEVAGADGAAIYFTLDIDALDPSSAPGAGAHEHGGLTPRFVSALIRRLAPAVSAFDIAEVNPMFDLHEMTSNLAGKLMWDLILARVAA